MHQYALLHKGNSIHSPCQLEWYKNDVNDKSVHLPGGLQRIQTLEGYIIPLSIKDGLARLDIRPYTDKEWTDLPHVVLTSENNWDPSVLDHVFGPDHQWQDIIDSDPSFNRFDEFGKYRQRLTIQHMAYFNRHDGDSVDDNIDRCIVNANLHFSSLNILSYAAHETDITLASDVDDFTAHPQVVIPKFISKKAPDFDALRPFFAWFSPEIIKKTFANTTQYARLPTGTMLKRAFKSPNPALNVYRRNESVACDIVYSDTPAIHDGSHAAVLFVGTTTQVTDVYGIKTERQFVNTLEDNIIQRGAPNKLISDRAQVLISNKVQDILRTLFIGNWQSEPHQQQQNPAERRYQTVKNSSNRLMDRTGAPPFTWLLCLQYICYLLNHMYNESLSAVPLTRLTGTTVDISPLLRFYFWQQVLYKKVKNNFPSCTKEALGNIVGISEHCGHALTWKILTSETQHIIYRSLVRPATPDDANLRAGMFYGEDNVPTSDPIIKSRSDCDVHVDNLKPATLICEDIEETDDGETLPPSPIFNPEDLVGRTFLMDEQEDGQESRA
jgi:hypothetical protein